MYLQNKYTRWYFNIIDRAKSRTINERHEVHHVLPKCLGGDDSNANLVKLLPKEHFLCHYLLTKMVPKSKEQRKLYHAFAAFNMASKNQQRNINSRQYMLLSTAAKEGMKGNTHNKGKVRSADANKKQSESMKAKYSVQLYVHTGKTYEEIYGKEEAEKRKNKLKGPRGPRKNPPGPQQVLTCPHCGKSGGVSNMKRYHFDNCGFQ